MRRLAIGSVVLACAASLAAISVPRGAQATTTAAPPSPVLAAQVKALSAQVRALKAQVTALRKLVVDNARETVANYEGDACLAAITSDALQETWLVLDKVAQPALNTTFFGTPGPVDDKGACSGKVTRKQLEVPPTVDVFKGLIKWISP
jgi:hypothetical protein